jgi:hypothetical protein
MKTIITALLLVAMAPAAMAATVPYAAVFCTAPITECIDDGAIVLIDDKPVTTTDEWTQSRASIFRPHGPFMMAVDPDGIIVNSQAPLVIVPKGYDAMAQAPANVPLPRPRPQN